MSLKDIIKTSIIPEHKSELNVPLLHSTYNAYDYYMDQGDNTHATVKPYVYSRVKPHLDLDVKKTELLQDRKTWFGRKLWNEHLVNVQGKDFWFTLDLPIDLQVGKDNQGVSTFNNTRALQINGGISKKFNLRYKYWLNQ